MNKSIKEEYIQLNYFLKCRRQALKIDKEDLAKRMDISTDLLSFWEDIILDNVDLGHMKKFSKLLRFNPLVFIEGLPEDAYKNWNNFIDRDFIDVM